MATITIYKCDRCDRDIPDIAEKVTIDLRYKEGIWEICQSCLKSLRVWMKNEQRIS